LFLENKDAEYTDTYATIMALRFHGTEDDIIPRKRLLEGLRLMLDRPQLADLVIPDLARWEDWSVVDKLVDLFKNSDDESSWVRVPVINYLRACPLPEAKSRIDELAKIDPESIKRANSFFPLGAAAAPATADTKKADDDGSEAKADAKETADKPAAETGASTSPPAGDADVAVTAGQESSNNQTQSTATAEPAADTAQVADHESAALVTTALDDDAAVPGPPVRSLPVFGGLAAAAGLLGLAFWAILKGGQRVPG
jgi:hypothetical protein